MQTEEISATMKAYGDYREVVGYERCKSEPVAEIQDFSSLLYRDFTILKFLLSGNHAQTFAAVLKWSVHDIKRVQKIAVNAGFDVEDFEIDG